MMTDRDVTGKQKGQSPKPKKSIAKAVAVFILLLVVELGIAAYLFINDMGMGEMGDWHFDMDMGRYQRVSDNSFGAVLVVIAMTLFIGVFMIRGMRKAKRK